jgi:hypothetical protein
MKINIGPYVYWFGPYQFARLLRFFGISKETCDKIAEWIPVGPFNFLHSLRKRKTVIHIDNYDIWNMDHTLALIITPMLKMLKEKKVGIPGYITVSEETGEEIPFDEAQKNWDEILDKMIWSFEQKLDDDWDAQFHKDGTFDREGYIKYSDKINEGFVLFGKHFNALWD